MFPRRFRIRREREIRDVFQKAKKYNTPPVTLWVVWKNTGPLRVAVLCSRKVDKRAVVRNKVKRRIREALRAIGKVHALHAEIIVSAKSTAKTVPTSEFKEIILHVLNLS
ncbi:MAG: ribonuclease P protein component [Candidatus Ryanbacteria bacterium RIFCSPLOWO2_12_FULL_47_9c]|uniref:Ribonuclease P protein component n=2 Tax=Candidatus Ryaniibacteriota TaxID=1817914 RepID=A0A1G2H1Q5_9BACT|nr:MAG: Ribonuclease P protein component [Parcubacteria group bacterium GW2011_GWA2_47_10b]KKU86133.1 MAG: Ribonuclease P protein component [Parcubacteria group bacterium GW2011_GWA1_47_9]OGZ47567.1 MAG: ribonuclease P protein component [Candidatus Ryanbacteria bacterium RIFCSPHIGHO2_01_FULL_48_80]OGZ50549.1 MAG: ribonuclease P protein component [Candidatus Ryanbacteria bacterium RIFCSPHIGHO2_02_FULL_47_25]OGZ52654.1 MAG: ribonuclease P protein component [Candidatus Ryanbacteria bacterium RIFCS